MSWSSALHVQCVQIYKASTTVADILFKCMYMNDGEWKDFVDARAPFHITSVAQQKLIITEECRPYFL